MRTFAVIENGIVVNIIVGVEDEVVAANPTTYIEYYPENPAGIGYTHDPVSNALIAPKPYASWLLNPVTYLWEAPTPRPIDENMYTWDESSLDWKVIS